MKKLMWGRGGQEDPRDHSKLIILYLLVERKPIYFPEDGGRELRWSEKKKKFP